MTLVTNPGAGGLLAVSGFWIQDGFASCGGASGCRGEISNGTFDPATGILKFSYFQPWNGITGTAEFTLTVTDTQMQLAGTYAQQGSSGTWTLTRPRGAPVRDAPMARGAASGDAGG